MTHTKNENGELLVTLTFIEQHVIIKALAEYSRKAFELTKNEAHSEAADKVYSDFTDAYVEMHSPDFIMLPTKRQKALIYMQQYVQSFPNTVIDETWMYLISIGEHTPTADALKELLGESGAACHVGMKLKTLIDSIKE